MTFGFYSQYRYYISSGVIYMYSKKACPNVHDLLLKKVWDSSDSWYLEQGLTCWRLWLLSKASSMLAPMATFSLDGWDHNMRCFHNLIHENNVHWEKLGLQGSKITRLILKSIRRRNNFHKILHFRQSSSKILHCRWRWEKWRPWWTRWWGWTGFMGLPLSPSWFSRFDQIFVFLLWLHADSCGRVGAGGDEGALLHHSCKMSNRENLVWHFWQFCSVV